MKYRQRNSRQNNTCRVVSILTALAFFFNSVLPANVSAFLTSASAIQKSFHFDLPPELGIVQDSYFPKSSAPFVIHIQDAHANPEAQKKIKDILKFLGKKAQTVALEGAYGRIDPAPFQFFKSLELNRKLRDSLLEAGELTGAELLAFDHWEHHENSTDFVGVDDPELYRQSLARLRQLFSADKQIRERLDLIDRSLDQKEKKEAGPQLFQYLKWKKEWNDHQNDFEKSLADFLRLAKDVLRMDLADPVNQFDYPQLVRVAKLREMEARYKPELAEKERKKLLTDVVGAIHELPLPIREGLSDLPHLREPRKFFERLYEETSRRGVPLIQYPNFLNYGGMLILQSELFLPELLKDIEKISGQLEKSLLKTKRDRELLSARENFILLSRLLKLELSSEEYQGVGAIHELPLQKNTQIQSWIDSAERFYQLSRKRDEVLLRNLLQKSNRSKVTVLITGGFHTAGLTKLMKEKGIGYAVISPRFTAAPSHSDFYHRIMLTGTANPNPLGMTNQNLAAEALWSFGNGPTKEERYRPYLAAISQQAPEGLSFSRLQGMLKQVYESRSELREENEKQEKTYKISILKPEYIGLFLFMSLHAAFFSASQLITLIKSESIGAYLLYLTAELAVAGLAGFFALRTQIGIHEGAHYIEAKKKGSLIGQKDTGGQKITITFTERVKNFFLIAAGKFQRSPEGYKGVTRDTKGNIFVETKRPELAIRRAGPAASLRAAQWFIGPSLAISALAYFIGQWFSIFAAVPVIMLGSYLFSIAIVGFVSYRETDDNAYEEAKALEAGKKRAKTQTTTKTPEEIKAQDEWRKGIKEHLLTGDWLPEIISASGRKTRLPAQDRNVMQGGQHAVIKRKVKKPDGTVEKLQFPRGNLTNQEIKIIPHPQMSLENQNAMVRDIQNVIETKLLGADAEQGLQYVGIGNEGGVLGIYRGYERQALQILMEAAREAGYEPGKDVFYSLDVAASELSNAYKKTRNQKGMYKFYMRGEGGIVDSESLANYLVDLVDEFPSIIMIEDGMAEDDIEGWKILRRKTYKKGLALMWDDVSVTNEDVIRALSQIEVRDDDGTLIPGGLGDVILFKTNQIGTLTETLLAAKAAEEGRKGIDSSHRSGKSIDTIEAELALALPHNIAIKTGGGQLSDRQIVFEYLAQQEQKAKGKKSAGKIQGDPEIVNFYAKEILTGDGRPTVGVFMELSDGNHFEARVPVGASAGEGEARHLTDGDLSRYDGAGTLKVARYLNDHIAPLFEGKKLSQLKEELGLKSLIDVDRLLLSQERNLAFEKGSLQLQSTREEQKEAMKLKNFMGANGTLPVSIVFARLLAKMQGLETWEYLQQEYESLGKNQTLDQNREYLYGFSTQKPSVAADNGQLLEAVVPSRPKISDGAISISQAEEKLGLKKGSITQRFPDGIYEALLDLSDKSARSVRVIGNLTVRDREHPDSFKKILIKKPNPADGKIQEGALAEYASSEGLGPEVIYADDQMILEEQLPLGYEISSRGLLLSANEGIALGQKLAEAFHKMITGKKAIYFGKIPQTHLFVLGSLSNGGLKPLFLDWSNSFTGEAAVSNPENQLKTLDQFAYLIRTFLARPVTNVQAWKSFEIRLQELQKQDSLHELDYSSLLATLRQKLIMGSSINAGGWPEFFDKVDKANVTRTILRSEIDAGAPSGDGQREGVTSNLKLEFEGKRSLSLLLQHEPTIDKEMAEAIAVDLFKRGYLDVPSFSDENITDMLGLFLESKKLALSVISEILKEMIRKLKRPGRPYPGSLQNRLSEILRSLSLPEELASEFIQFLKSQEVRRIAIRTSQLWGMRNREYGSVLEVYYEEDPQPLKTYVIKEPHRPSEPRRSRIASDLNLGPYVVYARDDKRERQPDGTLKLVQRAVIVEDLLPAEANIQKIDPTKILNQPRALDLLAKNVALKIYRMIDPKRGRDTVLHKFDGVPDHIYILEGFHFRMIDWAFDNELLLGVYDNDASEHLADIFEALEIEFRKFGLEFWEKFRTHILQIASTNGALENELKSAFEKFEIEQQLKSKKPRVMVASSHRSEVRAEKSGDIPAIHIAGMIDRWVSDIRAKNRGKKFEITVKVDDGSSEPPPFSSTKTTDSKSLGQMVSDYLNRHHQADSYHLELNGTKITVNVPVNARRSEMRAGEVSIPVNGSKTVSEFLRERFPHVPDLTHWQTAFFVTTNSARFPLQERDLKQKLTGTVEISYASNQTNNMPEVPEQEEVVTAFSVPPGHTLGDHLKALLQSQAPFLTQAGTFEIRRLPQQKQPVDKKKSTASGSTSRSPENKPAQSVAVSAPAPEEIPLDLEEAKILQQGITMLRATFRKSNLELEQLHLEIWPFRLHSEPFYRNQSGKSSGRQEGFQDTFKRISSEIAQDSEIVTAYTETLEGTLEFDRYLSVLNAAYEEKLRAAYPKIAGNLIEVKVRPPDYRRGLEDTGIASFHIRYVSAAVPEAERKKNTRRLNIQINQKNVPSVFALGKKLTAGLSDEKIMQMNAADGFSFRILELEKKVAAVLPPPAPSAPAPPAEKRSEVRALTSVKRPKPSLFVRQWIASWIKDHPEGFKSDLGEQQRDHLAIGRLTRRQLKYAHSYLQKKYPELANHLFIRTIEWPNLMDKEGKSLETFMERQMILAPKSLRRVLKNRPITIPIPWEFTSKLNAGHALVKVDIIRTALKRSGYEKYRLDPIIESGVMPSEIKGGAPSAGITFYLTFRPRLRIRQPVSRSELRFVTAEIVAQKIFSEKDARDFRSEIRLKFFGIGEDGVPLSHLTPAQTAQLLDYQKTYNRALASTQVNSASADPRTVILINQPKMTKRDFRAMDLKEEDQIVVYDPEGKATNYLNRIFNFIPKNVRIERVSHLDNILGSQKQQGEQRDLIVIDREGTSFEKLSQEGKMIKGKGIIFAKPFNKRASFGLFRKLSQVTPDTLEQNIRGDLLRYQYEPDSLSPLLIPADKELTFADWLVVDRQKVIQTAA